MNWLASISVRRPVFASVMVLSLLVVGIASFFGLPLERFPDVRAPFVVITTEATGLGPLEVEQQVSMRIEEAVSGAAGLERLDSQSVDGLSIVVAEFSLSRDPAEATNDVRELVSRASSLLPAAVRAPRVETFRPNDVPVALLAVSISGDAIARDPGELTAIADRLVRRRLQTVEGVARVSMFGDATRRIDITPRLDDLERNGLTVLDLANAIRTEHVDASGVVLLEGANEEPLRLRGRAVSVDDLAQLSVLAPSGAALVVGDLADLRDGAGEATSAARVDGNDVVLLAIRKRAGANTVALVESLRAQLPEIESRLPRGVQLTLVRDESEFVANAIESVEEHLVVGSFLAALVVLAFLRSGRSTLITALAIPTSIISTFAALRALGLTLDTITLLGLTLAVGIVIDDAIVVLENIVRRLEEHGGSPQEAAIHATSEIALAVLATTCSLVAVFLPVAFMDGIVGRFLASFGLTMSFSILVSMFVAFTLTPMLAARWLKAPKVQHPPPPTPKDVEAPRDERAFYRQVASGAPVLPGETSPWLERVYTRLLAWCLAHRWVVVVLMLATLASIVPLAAATPSAFLPTEDESRLELVVRLPEGTSLAETTRFVQRIADRIDALPEVEQTVLSAGRASGDDSARGANEASVYIGLTPASTRARSQAELVQVIREEVLVQFETMPDGTEIPLLWIAGVDAFGSSGAASAPIQWVMRGADLTRLAERAQALLVEARQIEGTGDHGLTLRADAPERTLRIDRNRARDRAVSTEAIAATLGWLSGDAVLGSIEDVSGSIELRMRPPTAVREQVEEALAVRVATSNGQRVPLGEVVTETRRLIPAAIERTDRERQITLYMSVGPGMSEGAVLEALRAAEARMGVPTEMRGSPAGNARELERTEAAFGWAFLMSLVFMYLVLAAQFESFIVPVVVLVSLPLTVPFALVSLLVMGQSLNLFSALGVLVLFGVVKKNAILQIDHTRHLSAQGWPRPLALLLANRDRLRPILMTTVAFVAGALPLVISAGAGAGANRAIGVVVMGGQSLALLLTLVATPVVGTLIDDAKRLFQRRAQRDENNGEG